MYYNSYNQNYFNELNKIFNKFDTNNINNYYNLLKLIYDIYFNENVFIIVNDDIKYQLESNLKLLIKKNNWFIDFEQTEKNILISLFIIITQKINFGNYYQINNTLKQQIESLLLDKNLINEKMIHDSKNVFHLVDSFPENESMIKFFKQYNIDIMNQEFLTIGDTKIPNFYLKQKNKMIDHYYEFCHLLFKIYSPILYYGVSFEEGYEYKITNKDIVFDCGGNMGLFALYCASKGAQVYCFEPMSYIRDFLYESQKLYPDLIHIIPCGVFNRNQEQYFSQTYNPGAGSNSIFHELEYTSDRLYKEKCKLITLDSFSQNNHIIPTFIKADIEGSEAQMLEGASQILQTYKPTMNICLNHRTEDQYNIPTLIYNINSNYSFYYFIEGEIHSKFVLCK